LLTYQLAFAWNWEYDSDFAAFLEAACARRQLSLLQIVPANLPEVLARLASGELAFQALYDRAGDADPAYLPLVTWAASHQALHVNEYHAARRAWDKATMHLEFMTAGLHIPNTIIVAPHAEQPDHPVPDLATLGSHFSIKPAHGGGGSGVITHATSWKQVQAARLQDPNDKYLLQEWITPAVCGERRAWFRPIYACGRVFLNWWDDQTHIYTPLTLEAEERLGLGCVREMVLAIAEVCQLDIFSTEIALDQDGRWLSVDYTNDPIDMRLQSKAAQGVPDAVVASIADALAAYAADWVRACAVRPGRTCCA
jgi:hypothetical protein